jgi:hypothetical protein
MDSVTFFWKIWDGSATQLIEQGVRPLVRQANDERVLQFGFGARQDPLNSGIDDRLELVVHGAS